ncbi:MAG TPA: twin-arginine translocase subunit TatC [Jatrophihabitans sp.]
MIRLPGWLRRKPANPDGRMSVMDHLRELRRRLIVVVIVVGLGAVLGWYLYPHVLDFLSKPYCHVPTKYRFINAADPNKCQLVYSGVLDGFTVRLKVSVITGMIFTSPLWLYQIWGFITPGLHKNERRYTFVFIITSTLLFAAGVVLAFVVLFKGIEAILQLSGSGTAALLTANAYITFVTLMLLVFGASFELPLIVVLANFAGVLSAKMLKKSQRMAVFLIFVFAAVATPTTDPFTMIAMAVPMVLLYEAAVIVATIHDRRKAARLAIEREAPHENDSVPSQIDPIPKQWKDRGADQWSDTT